MFVGFLTHCLSLVLKKLFLKHDFSFSSHPLDVKTHSLYRVLSPGNSYFPNCLHLTRGGWHSTGRVLRMAGDPAGHLKTRGAFDEPLQLATISPLDLGKNG